MIVDIGIVGVLLDRILETFKSFVGVSLLHVYAGNLHEALGEGRNGLDGSKQVFLGAIRIAGQESEA
jgi:hypothetical protein